MDEQRQNSVPNEPKPPITAEEIARAEAEAVAAMLRGEAPTPFVDGTGAQKHFDTVTCGGVAKKARRMHPPYIGGIGRTILEYQVAVPKEKSVVFRMDVGKGDGSDPGDGIFGSQLGHVLTPPDQLLA